MEKLDTIGKRIKHFRESKGMSQNELAEKIGVHYTSIFKWENESRVPKEKNIQKIANILGVNYLDLNTQKEVKKVIDKSIGEKIKYFRKKKNLTQKDLAKLSGINEESIQKYEQNVRKPSEKQMQKIANGLDINIINLLDISINSIGDVMSLLFKIDEVVDIEISVKKSSGVLLKTNEEDINSMIKKWGELKKQKNNTMLYKRKLETFKTHCILDHKEVVGKIKE